MSGSSLAGLKQTGTSGCTFGKDNHGARRRTTRACSNFYVEMEHANTALTSSADGIMT